MAGQLWAVNSLGGFLYSEKLSNRLRTALQPMTRFRQFCDVRDETSQGKQKGDTYKWDIVFNVATQGGTLVETNTMPETNFQILQASGSIYEWGNSVKIAALLLVDRLASVVFGRQEVSKRA